MIALACGGLAAWLSIGGTGDLTMRAEASHSPAVEMRQILVAGTHVEPGTVLSDTDFTWAVWPLAVVAESYMLREDNPEAPATLAGYVARSGFVKGEPILMEKMTEPGTSLLSLVLPAGMRAVAVKISAERTAGGFIMPHDRVDVIHTSLRHQAGGNGSLGHSRTILRNIRVLAVDQAAGYAGVAVDGTGKTATLEVTPDQAETLAAAESSGSISLALRSTMDAAEIHVDAPATESDTLAVRVVSRGKTEVMEVRRTSP